MVIYNVFINKYFFCFSDKRQNSKYNFLMIIVFLNSVLQEHKSEQEKINCQSQKIAKQQSKALSILIPD